MSDGSVIHYLLLVSLLILLYLLVSAFNFNLTLAIFPLFHSHLWQFNSMVFVGSFCHHLFSTCQWKTRNITKICETKYVFTHAHMQCIGLQPSRIELSFFYYYPCVNRFNLHCFCALTYSELCKHSITFVSPSVEIS